MFDLPCEYAKKAGLCKHPDAIDSLGRGRETPSELCCFGRCEDWEPNQDRIIHCRIADETKKADQDR